MSFAHLNIENLEEDKDTVNGGSYSTLETDVYDAIVELAYKGKSSGGAEFVNVSLDINGQKISETIYITSGNDKGNKIISFKYHIVDSLVFIATKGDKRINSSNLKFEPKVIEIWDSSEGKKVNKEVETISELTNKNIKVCIQKIRKNKYKNKQSINEPIEINTIFKFLSPKNNKTLSEILEKREATFHDDWLAQHKGITKDEYKELPNNSSSNNVFESQQKNLDIDDF